MKMMKKMPKMLSGVLIVAVVATLLLVAGCKDKDNDTPNPDEPDVACELTLFDGDNFSDDHITLKGPGEFPDLNNLADADKDWDDEADSFKAGENAVVTFFTEPNFEGDSTVYDA